MINKPNILILMTDQQRADLMGCAGDKVVQTPHMDRLAKEGTRFNLAYTPSPVCMPARASFITGLYPHNHHMWTNAGKLPAFHETLFQHLQLAGYFTAYIGKTHYVHDLLCEGKHLKENENYMHRLGIEYIHETTGPGTTVNVWTGAITYSSLTDYWKEKGLLEIYLSDHRRRRGPGGQHSLWRSPHSVWPSPLPTEDFLDSYIAKKSIEFVDDYTDPRPFCLFVGFGGPHPPWDAPGKYAKMYDPSSVPEPIPASELEKRVTKQIAKMKRRDLDINEEDIRKMRANYYGKISLVDYWIGKILASFENKGWLNDTLMVFWSDHGEMMGDHQRVGKGVFYESSVRVPLIFRWPGHIPAGEVSNTLTTTIDVYPTILETIGAEQPKGCFGKSLWDIFNGLDTKHRAAIFSEINRSGVMIRTSQFKYAINSSGSGYMLYDLISDPLEQNNLIGRSSTKEIQGKLSEQILRFLVQNQCMFDKNGDMISFS